MSDNTSDAKINYRKLAAACRVKPGTTVDLRHDFDPGRADHHLDKKTAVTALEQAKQELFALQDKFYAQATAHCCWCCRPLTRPARTGPSNT